MTALVRFGGHAALGAGALRVASTFIPYAPQSAVLEALYGLIDVGLLFGLLAIFLVVERQVGRLGLAGFVAAFAATASIVGPDANFLGADFYRIGASLLVLGLCVLAIQMVRGRVLLVPALFWLASTAFGLASLATGLAFFFAAAGVALGLGFAIAGWRLSSFNLEGAKAPSP